MKWVSKQKAAWPVQEMPKGYFVKSDKVPDIGALNAILVTFVNTIKDLEYRVESLERQVHDLQQWP